MKIRLFVFVLGFACLFSEVKGQACNLTGGVRDVPFPDILKNVADSYIMGVEYSVPGAKQTDYYTEFYEYEFKRGRVDGHQAGENFRYIYRSETWEAWTIKGDTCELKNITMTPGFFKDDQTDWVHSKGTEQFTTIGPSAMFKVAYDEWQKQPKNMMYMGKSKSQIRGEDAVFFRRCNDYGYVDYFFAAGGVENPFDVNIFKEVITPLRVAFTNITGEQKAMSNQYYDILSFQHKIPSGVEPFELPKGKNCQRGLLVEEKKLSNFSTNNLLLSAEVLYRKISTKDGENEILSSYYSTLTFALDKEIQHVAYLYSSWNTTKPDKDHQEPFLNAPHYIIYDMKHKYSYTINYETAKCTIARNESFIPTYTLPENGGGIALTDPYVLFPNNEVSFLTKGKERGLDVNIFEVEQLDYMLDAQTKIDRVIVSHSYYTNNEEVENAAPVKGAPAQIELQLFRDAKSNIKEILTFNIFGFTTKLPKERYLFSISRCFLNDDDYSYVTIGFEPEERHLPALLKRLPDVETNVVRQVTMKSELNAVRIPFVVTDVKNNKIFVTMLILGKPPVQLDFVEEEGMTILVDDESDKQGVSNFETCANNCLETRSNCWGFSMCGATCFYGSDKNVTKEKKQGCSLYKRFMNETYIQSKTTQVNNIVGQVEAGEFMTMLILDTGEQVELKATIVQVTDPAQDDSLFERMGDLLNPRMRVHKSATKLKKGSSVKNLGKLRYDECQKLCLDFKDCETLSYCLKDSECKLSSKFAADLQDTEVESNNLCNLLARKYADHFDRIPGIFVSADGGTKVDAPTVEDCARACMKQDKFQCLSFDHCAGGDKDGCRLYTTHYLNAKTREDVQGRNARCGHYSRKLSAEFKKKAETRVVGKSFEVITNLTMEECAKRCIEYEQGSCYAYDFCQDSAMFATSCTLIDTDPSRLKTSYSPICTNYARSSADYAPRPYSNAYAGGIGFLCFLIGGIVGALVIFAIAYIRVNRG